MEKCLNRPYDRPIAMLTTYDAPTAKRAVTAGVDILLVGDSIGPNMLGYDHVHEVTVADICHHTAAVRRGAPEAIILSDIPFEAMNSPEQALESARAIVAAGATAVKLEMEEGRDPYFTALIDADIEVCSHIGYTPQTPGLSVTVQGRDEERATELLALGQRSEKLGATMIVLELMPAELSKLVTETLAIPTIGIGAGPHCSGQVQVWYDIAGYSDRLFRHTKLFGDAGQSLVECYRAYADAVHDKAFPTMENCASVKDELITKIKGAINE